MAMDAVLIHFTGDGGSSGRYVCCARIVAAEGAQSFAPVVELASRHPSAYNNFCLAQTLAILQTLPTAPPHQKVVRVEIPQNFVYDGLTRWVKNWQSNGWITKSGTPVKNRGTWEELIYEVDRVGAVLTQHAGLEEPIKTERQTLQAEANAAAKGVENPVAESNEQMSDEEILSSLFGRTSSPKVLAPAPPAPMLPSQGMW